MPYIERSRHLQPSSIKKSISCADIDSVSTKDDQDSDDSHTLAKVMKDQGKKTA